MWLSPLDLSHDPLSLVLDLESRLSEGKIESIDFSTVIEELEKIQAPLSYSWGVVGHLMGVKNSDDLRKSHDTLQVGDINLHEQLRLEIEYHRMNFLCSLRLLRPIKRLARVSLYSNL